MTDQEFEQLEQRVKAGKTYLSARNWNTKDPEIRYYIQVWKELCDTHLEALIERGSFQVVKPTAQILEEAEEKVNQMKMKAIIDGVFTGDWTRPWLRAYLKKKGKPMISLPRRKKGGRITTNGNTKSQSISLFTTS